MWEVKSVSMNNDEELKTTLAKGWEPIGAIPVGTHGFFKWLFRRQGVIK